MTTVIRSDSAPTFEQPGTRVTGLAAPSRGAREIAAWRLRLEPGAASPEHALTHEEVFVVLSGRLEARLEGERHLAGPGDALVVEPGVAFVLAADGDEPAEAIACMRCGGMARVGEETIAVPWAQ